MWHIKWKLLDNLFSKYSSNLSPTICLQFVTRFKKLNYKYNQSLRWMKWWNFIEEYSGTQGNPTRELFSMEFPRNSWPLRTLELLKGNPACQKVTAHYDRTQKQRAEECVEKIVQKMKKTPKKKNPGRVRLINWDQVSLTNHTKRHRNQ